MKLNQKCVVSSDHKFWPGRVGYFQFYGEGLSDGTAVLSAEPSSNDGPKTLFSVRKNQIKPAV